MMYYLSGYIFYDVAKTEVLYNLGKEDSFMKRGRVSRRSDRRVVRKTLNKTKTINVKPAIMRGGIRL